MLSIIHYNYNGVRLDVHCMHRHNCLSSSSHTFFPNPLLNSLSSIKCQCGKVELKFPSSAPRVSTECCCNHCHNRLKYLANLGGPPVPDAPLVASKWENRIEIISGRSNLFAYRLNSTTKVTNIASTCCKTFLLGRQPEYDANCVTTQREAAVYCNLKEGAIVPYARFFANQWNKERLSKYEPMIAIWVDESADGSIVGEEGWEELFNAHIESINRDIPDDAVGISFEEILDDVIGQDNIIIVSEEQRET